MGNVLDRMARMPARVADRPYQPNIPFNNDNANAVPQNAVPQNDLNRPHSAQTQDMVLHLAVPLLFVAAYAYERYQRKSEADRVMAVDAILKTKDERLRAEAKSLRLKYERKESDLKSKLEEITRRNQMLTDAKKKASKAKADLKRKTDAIEYQEQIRKQQKLQQLKYYENGLEAVLDIRCSAFKLKENRLFLQDQLMSQLSSEEFSGIRDHVKYDHLKLIYDHDHHFCGRNKQENGLLRHVFVMYWKSRLALEEQEMINARVKYLHSEYEE